MINIDQIVNNYRDDIIRSTQEAVRIKSVEEKRSGAKEPFGEGVRAALDYMIDLGEDLGFKSKDFDGYAAHIDYGDQDEIVGVLAHVDVVPEGSGWTYPPYGGEIHGGNIYGRGSMDNKGPAIASIYAMRILKDLDLNLNRRIRLILGANEETDWKCMDYYFKHEEAPDMAFTPDANFPVIYGEMGIMNFNLEANLDKDLDNLKLIELKGGEAINMVAESAKAVFQGEKRILEEFASRIEEKIGGKFKYDLRIEESKLYLSSYGLSAHGSMPEDGENAISHMMYILEKTLDENSGLYELTKIYNEKIAYNLYGEKIGCGFEDEISGKLIFNVGLLELKNKKVKIGVNVRFPISNKAEEIYDAIDKNLENSILKLVKTEKSQDPLYVNKDSFLVEELMKVYREETGDDKSQPITIGGGTYARAMDNAVGFGPIFPGQVEVIHQKNEFISIDHLMKLVKIYTKALYALAK